MFFEHVKAEIVIFMCDFIFFVENNIRVIF